MDIQQTLTREQWQQVRQNTIEDYNQALRAYARAGRPIDKLTKQFNADIEAIDRHMNEV